MTDYWKRFSVVVAGEEDLGGNLAHGDTNATTPKLWRYLVDRFAVRSMLDVGAGEGHALAFFRSVGVIAHGFDGLDRNLQHAKHPMALHNLADSPYIYPCDMTLCIEVVEHIEEEKVDHVLATLTNAPVVVMTHALPGQPGHHHVNTQPQDYWESKLHTRGYHLSRDNEFFRSIARQEVPESYFGKSGLVFLKAVD